MCIKGSLKAGGGRDISYFIQNTFRFLDGPVLKPKNIVSRFCGAGSPSKRGGKLINYISAIYDIY